MTPSPFRGSGTRRAPTLRREMVIALTDATLPDLPIPAAVWQYARAVADTTL